MSMTMKTFHDQAVAEIQKRGMIVHPKCIAFDETKPAVVILACFFGQNGCAAISISGLEMLRNSSPDAVKDLIEARVSVAFNTLRTRVLEENGHTDTVEVAAA